MNRCEVLCGDSLSVLQEIDLCVDWCVTSPPYFQICDYRAEGQIGLECSIEDYLGRIVSVFAAVKKKLPEGGVCWIVIGDTSNNYSPIRGKGERRSATWSRRRSLQNGFIEKEFLGIPFLLREALREDGWRHRNTLIWDKGQCGAFAGQRTDTPPQTHEYILQMFKWSGKSRPYLHNCQGLGRSVLSHSPAADPVHPCPFPVALVKDLLSASTQPMHLLDPFAGSGNSAIAALEQGWGWTGIELNPEYCQQIKFKLEQLAA